MWFLYVVDLGCLGLNIEKQIFFSTVYLYLKFLIFKCENHRNCVTFKYLQICHNANRSHLCLSKNLLTWNKYHLVVSET